MARVKAMKNIVLIAIPEFNNEVQHLRLCTLGVWLLKRNATRTFRLTSAIIWLFCAPKASRSGAMLEVAVTLLAPLKTALFLEKAPLRAGPASSPGVFATTSKPGSACAGL